ncbi:E3 ubiquitin-protein ligase UBR1 isoform X2 [Hyperolius riggenbachi]|uniref:E3 ubiquitin-protein ligase UBR1 isoform X2 n=1 Tax=Hyperolius riggenbachi TaxID=752182 RepID=UPI0035A31823
MEEAAAAPAAGEEPGRSEEQPVRTLNLDDAVDFDSAFYQYLRENVPRIYASCTHSRIERQERLAETCILTPLEWYLFGEDPSVFTERLRQSDSPPLCGRVFIPGETTYSCRDCAIDPTCVLCMSCFENSIHQDHRYKMHSSGGGGLCDCGDVEAWKSGPYCKIHEPGPANQGSEFRLPEEVLARARKVLPVIMKYLVDMLLWDLCGTCENELPDYLNSQQKSQYYYCLFYGGDSRCNDASIYSVQRVMQCSVKDARDIVAAAEREGRITVKEGNFEECTETAAELKKYAESVSPQHLNFDVMPSEVMAHQAFACSLGLWLNKILAYSSDFRQLFCQLCLEPNKWTDSEETCYVGFLVNNDARVHKGFRKIFYDLIFSSFFLEMEYKKLFAIEFVKHYRHAHREHMNDDHNKDSSLTGFSVQLFTVPTLARLLIEETSILRILTETLVDILPICFDVEKSSDKFTFQSYNQDRSQRVYTILCDLKYVLANKPASWSEKLEVMFMDGLDALLEFLSFMQDMEATPRMLGQHIEIETDWETAIAMQMQLKNILLLLQEWLVSNNEYRIELLIESPLRCLVLLGQVAAEMWRRNGLTFVSQVHYYHDVKCREQMYDKDIVMMQIGASYMDPNIFMLMMIDKYELKYAVGTISIPATDMDLVKQVNIITEEMLHALICIISERYVPGVGNVTKEECLTREIIQLLCIEPMSHSALIKALPDTENENINVEALINRVATFKKPSLSGHGVYELKEEYFDKYNLLFYHYSKSQRSKAEDSQKKRRKQENISEALPPPPPPDFTPAFQSVRNLLCCDVLMHLLRTLMQRALDEDPAFWSESIIQMVLHIMALGLIEEKQQLQTAPKEGITFDFYYKATRLGSSDPSSLSVFSLLGKLRSLTLLDSQKDMICWLQQMFEIVKQLHEKSEQSETASSSDVGKVDATQSSQERETRKRKAEAAKLHRQRIMAQMTALQKNFIETNKFLYDTTQKMYEESSQMEISLPAEEGPRIALGPNRGPSLLEKQEVTCILCQEEQEETPETSTLVLTSFVQKSAILCQSRGTTISADFVDPLFTRPELSVGTYSGGCGHVMHGTCWQKFYAATEGNRRHHQLHVDLIYEMVKGEYLCPLCKCHCNTAVPVLPCAAQQINRAEADALGQVLSLQCWLDVVAARISGYNLSILKGVRTVEAEFPCSENQSYEFGSILSFGVQPIPNLMDTLKEAVIQHANRIFEVGVGVPPAATDPRLPLMTWNSCAYTIQIFENLLHEEGKPLFGSLQSCQLANLKALVKCLEAQRVTCPHPTIRTHLVQLLAVFLPNMTLEQNPSLLAVDAFHLLVGSVAAFPSLYWDEVAELYPSVLVSAFHHLYLFRLITMTHILQIIFTSAAGMMPSKSAGDNEGDVSVANLFHDLSLYTNGALPANPSDWFVWNCVKQGILPYLRCAALFFYCLLGVAPPEELNSIVNLEDQFEALCSYLCLPTNLFLLFEENRVTMKPLLQRFCSDPAVLSVVTGKSLSLRYPRSRPTLIRLPENYSTLLNKVSSFRCPKSQHTEHKQPAMCLLCGAILCSHNTCCQEIVNGEELGACTAHSQRCGADLCIFLKIRECKVVILEAKTRGCISPAPYLDEYGETDPGLKRGNPLRLSHERYRKLLLQWLQHTFVEEIALTLEAQDLHFGFNWTTV